MKITTIIRASIFSALLIFVPLFFTGCQDIIYAKIMNEVTLDDATISGHVNSIVRFSNNIYIQNGNVYYKAASSASHDTWNKYTGGLSPLSYDYYAKVFNGMQIIKLAADSQYLYALGAEYKENENDGENPPSSINLYYSNGAGSSWKKIASYSYSSSSDITIFCTNTPNSEYRKAYLRISSGDNKGVYRLNGGTLDTTPTDSSATSACSAIYDYASDNVYFNNNWATGSNATTSTTSSSTVYYYYADDDILYYSTDSSFDTSNPTYGHSDLGITNIISMAVTSNAILLGTNGGGLYKVSNTTGVPGSSTETFSTNADSALGSPYRILAMLSVDPSATETGATIYASADFTGTSSSSTGDYSDIGLWSYYAGRGNWNRE